MASKAESLTIADFMIRRYLIYKDVWLTFIREVLYCCHDEGSSEGLFGLSIAVKQKCLLF